MRKGTIITLGASAAFGVLAIVLARGFINSAVNTQYEQSRVNATVVQVAKPQIKTVPVLVADMGLVPGDVLTEQSVILVEYPAKSVPSGSYSSYEKLFVYPDKPSVVLTQIAQGEPILGFKISAPGGRASLSANLGENMRAVSIRVNDVTGVAGFVRPDDRVDVHLTREVEPASINRFGGKSKGGDRKPTFTAELLLQDVKVLGTDQTTSQSTAIGHDGPKLAKTVTLEVDARQAQKLALAKAVGTMTLALRAAGANQNAPLKTIGVADLASQKTNKAQTAIRRKGPQTKPTPDQTAQVVVVRDGEPRLVKVYRDTTSPKDMAELKSLAGGAQ